MKYVNEQKVSQASNTSAVFKVICLILAFLGIIATILFALDYSPYWWVPLSISAWMFATSSIFSYMQNSLDLKQEQTAFLKMLVDKDAKE